MAHVELGKGIGSLDTVHIYNATSCQNECQYSHPPHQCIRTNGDATILFPHGVTRNTIKEVEQQAPCAH